MAASPRVIDDWHKMAAPRHRVEVVERTLAQMKPESVVDLVCGNGAVLDDPDAILRNALGLAIPGKGSVRRDEFPSDSSLRH